MYNLKYSTHNSRSRVESNYGSTWIIWKAWLRQKWSYRQTRILSTQRWFVQVPRSQQIYPQISQITRSTGIFKLKVEKFGFTLNLWFQIESWKHQDIMLKEKRNLEIILAIFKLNMSWCHLTEVVGSSRQVSRWHFDILGIPKLSGWHVQTPTPNFDPHSKFRSVMRIKLKSSWIQVEFKYKIIWDSFIHFWVILNFASINYLTDFQVEIFPGLNPKLQELKRVEVDSPQVERSTSNDPVVIFKEFSASDSMKETLVRFQDLKKACGISQLEGIHSLISTWNIKDSSGGLCS